MPDTPARRRYRCPLATRMIGFAHRHKREHWSMVEVARDVVGCMKPAACTPAPATTRTTTRSATRCENENVAPYDALRQA
jgi:hypothetical protein